MFSPWTPAEVARYRNDQLPNLKKEGENWRGPCPVHGTDKSDDNFMLYADGVCKCFSHDCTTGIFDLHRKTSGLDQKASDADVFRIVGRGQSFTKSVTVATYIYRDENGVAIHYKDRVEPGLPDKNGKQAKKSFFQYHNDVTGKKIRDLKGVRQVPYYLSDVIKSEGPVFVNEGEKAVDKLRGIGVTSATCSAGGSVNWNRVDDDLIFKTFKDREVIIIRDNDKDPDVATKVYRNIEKLASRLKGVARIVKILDLPDLPEAGDAFDWVEAGGTAERLRELAADAPENHAAPVENNALAKIDESGSETSWRPGANFLCNRNGVMPILANAIAAFEYAPEWENALGYDEFKSKPVFKKPVPQAEAEVGDITDQNIRWAANWLQRVGINVGIDTAGQAMYAVAQKGGNCFHPVREYLNSLNWDETPRVERWLNIYLGVEDTPYSQAVGRCWLISAVARIMKPGCKADPVLILEGPQGKLKSTAVECLAGVDAWFTNNLPAIGEKDSKEQLCGKWIIELAELSTFRGRDKEKIKDFLSTRVDTYRRPYGRTTVDLPRQTVFFGTTNATTYFEDETGNRRFWPVTVGKVDLAKIADRDQLWAEAVALYQCGTQWWLDAATEALAEEEQGERYSEDDWQPLIERWCNDPQPRQYDEQKEPAKLLSMPGRVLTTEILDHCLGKFVANYSKRDSDRVAAILRVMKWKRGKLERVNTHERRRFHYRPDYVVNDPPF